MLHSVVIPCYKSSQTIRKVVEETERRNSEQPPTEIVRVDK